MRQPLTAAERLKLGRQSLRRPITQEEARLAEGLEQIFKAGIRDFNQVVLLLQQNGVQPPSGAPGPWTIELLQAELAASNASFDEAYSKGGPIAG